MQRSPAPTRSATGAAIAQSVLDRIKRELDAVMSSLPPGVTGDRIVASAAAAFSRTPEIWTCDESSIVRVVVEAAQVGLPVGLAGLAYVVPFWDRARGGKVAQLVIGYRGLLSLARECRDVEAIGAQVIREGDRYKIRLGTDPSIEHEPALSARPIIGAYAYCRIRGQLLVEVMSDAEIAAIADLSRRGSRNGERSLPWREHYAEMAKKTVIRRLMKLVPWTEKITKAFALEGEVYDDTPAPRTRLVTSTTAALQVAAERVLEPPVEAPSEPEPAPEPPRQPAARQARAAEQQPPAQPRAKAAIVQRRIDGEVVMEALTRDQLTAWLQHEADEEQLRAFISDNEQFLQRVPDIREMIEVLLSSTTEEDVDADQS